MRKTTVKFLYACFLAKLSFYSLAAHAGPITSYSLDPQSLTLSWGIDRGDSKSFTFGSPDLKNGELQRTIISAAFLNGIRSYSLIGPTNTSTTLHETYTLSSLPLNVIASFPAGPTLNFACSPAETCPASIQLTSEPGGESFNPGTIVIPNISKILL